MVIEAAPSRDFRRASTRVAEVRGRYYIEALITKNFNDISYDGNVVIDNGRWYKIIYKDDDGEEQTHCEMIQILNRETTSKILSS